VTARRLYVPAVLALLALGGLAFFAASRTWMSMPIHTPGLPPDRVTASGSDAYPLVPALAIVVAAAALAVIASRGWIRRAVGVLIVAASFGAALSMLDGNHAIESALGDAVAKSPAYTESTSTGDPVWTEWDLVTLAAFALAALVGVTVVVLADHWPTMGSRYEAPAAKAEMTEGDLWSAMDEGRDPTE
jgi:uncharacterized membrane protein (TIGR02234 family)